MRRQSGHLYEFGSFRLDPQERVLFDRGEPVSLSPKLFDTLLVLVSESGHIVEKEDLIARVWPDTFVEENNLSQYISTLRRTLGNGQSGHRYIETIPRRGYRFTVDVRELWNGDTESIREAHTKVSLVVTEEKEVEEKGSRGERETSVGKDPSFLRRLRSVLLPAITTLAAAAIGVTFGLYQFGGEEQLAAAESRVSPGMPAAKAFTIKTFDPSIWPRTDKEIGVEDFVIEDFEDDALVEGLRIELSDTADGFEPTDSLPMAFHPDIDDSGGARVFVAGVWDGSRLFINRRSPPPHGYADFAWGDVTFHIAGGASSFGFSLHEMDLNTELYVNGISVFNLRRLLPSGSTRGGYLRIDAAPGEAILTVKVANSATPGTGDGLGFDHVAFKPL